MARGEALASNRPCEPLAHSMAAHGLVIDRGECSEAQALCSPVICGRPPLASLFFDVVNDLVCCGHMSGLLVRTDGPLALMISDGRGPYHCGELGGS